MTLERSGATYLLGCCLVLLATPSAAQENSIRIDVGRLFKVPQTDGTEKWQFNYLGRKKKSGLKVLVRNAMFESNISQSESAVDRCLYDIEQAFKLRQPAIISNHRACFTGRIDDNNRRKGLFELDLLLKSNTNFIFLYSV